MTNIEWADKSWNPVTGCTKVSAGCLNCYAEKMAKRLSGRFGYPVQPWHFSVSMHRDKLSEPKTWKKPQIVFVCSMSDLFHKEIAPSYLKSIFRIMETTPQHMFLVLTKRPKRAYEWFRQRSTGPIPNISLGVTVENQAMVAERLPWLARIPAALRFVSCEPLLEEVTINDYLESIDWVIAGGETGHPSRHMRVAWARKIRDEADKWGKPFFFKKMSGIGKRAKNIPIDLQIREYPYIFNKYMEEKDE